MPETLNFQLIIALLDQFFYNRKLICYCFGFFGRVFLLLWAFWTKGRSLFIRFFFLVKLQEESLCGMFLMSLHQCLMVPQKVWKIYTLSTVSLVMSLSQFSWMLILMEKALTEKLVLIYIVWWLPLIRSNINQECPGMDTISLYNWTNLPISTCP